MTRRRQVHQVLIGASDGDAVTGMALALRDGLRDQFNSEIYALWRHGTNMQHECRSLEEAPQSSEVDLMIYHLSIGYPDMHDWLCHRTEPLALCYHNVTPGTFYRKHNPVFARDLDLGRSEINLFRSRVVLAIADSAFNANDLLGAGYDKVHVIPAGLAPHRLVAERYDAELLSTLRRRYPNGYVLAVGQVLPHKRVEQLMQTLHLMNSTFWMNVGLVICGPQRQQEYFASLLRYRSVCSMVDVHFSGAVTDRELSTLFRSASVFLGMSDHEGYCIPPVEAAAMSVPVVIKDSGAVSESIGDAALLLPSDAGPLLASEAVHEVLVNRELRRQLVSRGLTRAREISENDHVTETVRLVSGLLK